METRAGPDESSTFASGALAALCAILVGIGLARFAYSPLIPALVSAGWFTPSEAAYLGAANLAGYLAGALAAMPLAARVPARACLRWTMVLAAVSFFACAVRVGFPWFLAWRFASGLCGGILMVLAAPTVMPQVPLRYKGVVAGFIFAAVGLGIAASGTLVPLLLQVGLAATWCGLGGLALALTLLAWQGWPKTTPKRAIAQAEGSGAHAMPILLSALVIAYGLNAIGLVAHMLFLVDYVARGLGQGIEVGSRYWILFGGAAMLGPVAAGRLADAIGFGLAVRLAYLAQALAVGVLVVSGGTAALILSVTVVGAFLPGITSLVLGRANELVGPDPEAHRQAWRSATIAFAIGQAAGAYGYSYLFARTGDYTPLFGIAALALALALALDTASVVLAAHLGRIAQQTPSDP